MIESIVSTVSSQVSKSKLSAKKRRANQRNARKSTGPITLLGKWIASQNAITHAVFSAHVVLPGEYLPSFVYLRQCFINSLQPQDLLQLSFVDRIAADQWRLRRLDESEHRLFELRAYEHQEFLRLRREGELDVEDDERASQRWCRIDPIIDPMSNEQFEAYANSTTTPALTMTALMEDKTPVLERYNLHRQRLQNSIQRALRELRTLQKTDKDAEKLPLSPYMKSNDQIREELKSMGEPLVEPDKPADQPAEAPAAELTEATEIPKSKNEPTEEKTAATSTLEKACGEAAAQESSKPCSEPVLRAASETINEVYLNNLDFG